MASAWISRGGTSGKIEKPSGIAARSTNDGWFVSDRATHNFVAPHAHCRNSTSFGNPTRTDEKPGIKCEIALLICEIWTPPADNSACHALSLPIRCKISLLRAIMASGINPWGVGFSRLARCWIRDSIGNAAAAAIVGSGFSFGSSSSSRSGSSIETNTSQTAAKILLVAPSYAQPTTVLPCSCNFFCECSKSSIARNNDEYIYRGAKVGEVYGINGKLNISGIVFWTSAKPEYLDWLDSHTGDFRAHEAKSRIAPIGIGALNGYVAEPISSSKVVENCFQ